MSDPNNENNTTPSTLVSRETLIYVGLTEEKATELWDRWINWPTYGPSRYELDSDDGLQVTFCDICSQSLKGQQDTCDEEDDTKWTDCMDACGISRKVQEAIMDPHFKYMRTSDSCLSWVEDTIDMRYSGLEYRMELAAKEASNLEGVPPQQPTDQANEVESSHSPSANPSALVSPTPASFDAWTPKHLAAPPGYTALVKPIEELRLLRFLMCEDPFEKTWALADLGESDISRRTFMCLTPDFEVAEHQASHLARRDGLANTKPGSISIVCIYIRTTVFDAARDEGTLQELYSPNLDWKELLFLRRTARGRISPPLQKYKQATLVVGTMSRKPKEAFRNIKSSESIDESWVLKVGSGDQKRAAVQYVFSGEDEYGEFLLDNGVLEHLKIVPVDLAELEARMAMDARGQN